ncbi:uncharacterized protein [Panulirus ornatus]|uniref:uncharacterized protein n=1 Tax=Panulirus ornatus TaxID=150431 RepID=UPI003A835530
MATLVLTKSYAGTLMSLLAVRHIPQPYQYLRDVVDDPYVTFIMQAGTLSLEEAESIKVGLLPEVITLVRERRIIFKPLPQYLEVMDTLVKRGDHVLEVSDMDLKMYMAQHFTLTGECYFYGSKEKYHPFYGSMVVRQDSPLLPALDKRILAMTEAGLFHYWMRSDQPNSTVCENAQSKITVKTPLTLSNIWVV